MKEYKYKQIIEDLKSEKLIEDSRELEQYFSNFLYLNPKGDILEGLDGIKLWCQKQNLPFEKTLVEYLEINEPYNRLRQQGIIDATAEVKSDFGEDLQMDKMVFCEFYKIPRFVKTRVGQILLHAKQTQNEKYIRLICDEFAPRIREFAKGFESICFAPPNHSKAITIYGRS